MEDNKYLTKVAEIILSEDGWDRVGMRRNAIGVPVVVDRDKFNSGKSIKFTDHDEYLGPIALGAVGYSQNNLIRMADHPLERKIYKGARNVMYGLSAATLLSHIVQSLKNREEE